MEKQIALLIIVLIFPLCSVGQVQSVLPVATAKDGSLGAVAYDWEVIGVNPANLGWDINHQFSFTILDAGLSAQSLGMTFPRLMSAMESSDLATRDNSWQQILGVPNGANVNADINWFALSFRIPSIPGAFAVNMRDRIISNAFLGPGASQALIHSNDGVYNDSTIMSFLNGTKLSYEHYREINIDYGVGLFHTSGNESDLSKCFSFTKREAGASDQLKVYGGIGFKYIFGIADINGGVSDGGLDAIYEINNKYPNIPGGFFNTPGHGYAFDFGLSAKYKHWTFGLSVTDIGSIKWKQGSVVYGDTSVATIRHGSDFINELKNGTVPGSVAASSYSTSLPTDIRGAASYKVNKKVLLSSDIIYPIVRVPYGLAGPYFALGAELKASKLITLSAGFATTQNYGWGIPLGVTFNATHNIQFYLGTADITSYLGKQNANVSAAVWMFRYNF